MDILILGMWYRTTLKNLLLITDDESREQKKNGYVRPTIQIFDISNIMLSLIIGKKFWKVIQWWYHCGFVLLPPPVIQLAYSFGFADTCCHKIQILSPSPSSSTTTSSSSSSSSSTASSPDMSLWLCASTLGLSMLCTPVSILKQRLNIHQSNWIIFQNFIPYQSFSWFNTL